MEREQVDRILKLKKVQTGLLDAVYDSGASHALSMTRAKVAELVNRKVMSTQAGKEMEDFISTFRQAVDHSFNEFNKK